MTFEEKADSLTMSNGLYSFKHQGYVGGFKGPERLGIPKIRYNDGPQGFRTDNAVPGSSTTFPSLLALGMTWDADLVKEMGAAMGKEFADKGAHVQLGPAVNVQRIPLCGRNFEYLSGEDPILGAKLVGPLVEGIQTEVMANVKHFVDNSQETNRMIVNENVDERTNFEMYYPPF